MEKSSKSVQPLFSERLKAIRIERGLTQERLAIMAGMSVGSVRNLEGGARTPAWETLHRLTAVLGDSMAIWDGCRLEEE